MVMCSERKKEEKERGKEKTWMDAPFPEYEEPKSPVDLDEAKNFSKIESFLSK